MLFIKTTKRGLGTKRRGTSGDLEQRYNFIGH